jgi:hypothetical protein
VILFDLVKGNRYTVEDSGEPEVATERKFQ